MELLVSSTLMPLAVAGPVNSTVPAQGAPPPTVAGLRLKADNAGERSVNEARAVDPFAAAATLTTVLALTGTVAAKNVTKVAPAGTVTDFGPAHLLEVEVSDTAMPPVGAAPPRTTLPLALLPPAREVGVKAIKESFGGVICKVADFEVAPMVALTVTLERTETGAVTMANEMERFPTGTVAVDGPTIAEFVEEIATAAPP